MVYLGASCGLRAAGCGLRAAGCGLRQGEIFGLAVDNITDLGWLYVRQQVKKVDGPLVFAPPKRGKLRDVPLDPEVSAALRKHMARFPSVEATLPWLPPTGPRVTHPLVFTSGIGAAIWSRAFKDQAWKPAAASAGIQRVADQRLPGRRRPCHRACTRY
jgi:integrase